MLFWADNDINIEDCDGADNESIKKKKKTILTNY